MLVFAKEHREKFDALAQEAFTSRLVEYLCEDGSGALRFFPPEQRSAIASNLTARSRGWGFEWETNIGLLSDLMLSIAPNLDHHLEFQKVLRTAKDGTLEVALASLSPDFWEQAERMRQYWPAWVSPEFDTAEVREVFDACLGILAWDIEPDRRRVLYDSAAHAVSELRLPTGMDGLCVAALWIHLYGTDREKVPWLAPITQASVTSHTRLEALRTRIMLDHARLV